MSTEEEYACLGLSDEVRFTLVDENGTTVQEHTFPRSVVGTSDFEVVRALNRKMQALYNEAATEAMLAAPRRCLGCLELLPCACCPPVDPLAPKWMQ